MKLVSDILPTFGTLGSLVNKGLVVRALPPLRWCRTVVEATRSVVEGQLAQHPRQRPGRRHLAVPLTLGGPLVRVGGRVDEGVHRRRVVVIHHICDPGVALVRLSNESSPFP